MPDIGFTELLLAAIVGLLVIGPEQLPGSIRTLTRWIGTARSSFNKIKDDLEREIGVDEIRQQLRGESILAGYEQDKEQLEALDNSLKEQALKQQNTNFLDSLIGNSNKA
jgi:sec-independent protein translocase protein TatB